MTEKELITKALEEAYAFVNEQERTIEKDELLLILFKAKILVNNLDTANSGQQRDLLIKFKNAVNRNCSDARFDIEDYVVDDYLSKL